MAHWVDIAFELPPELTDDVHAAWSWLLTEPWEQILCSKIAGIFLKCDSGEVLWLDTAAALVDPVAATVEQFHDACRNNLDIVHEWFGTGLVEQLHCAGITAGAGECYGFKILPVFAQGKYAPDNMFVCSIHEQFVSVADVHKQLAALPDGGSVQIKIKD